MRALLWPALGGLVALAACSPAMDWREVRIPDTPLVSTWPCKPDAHARMVNLSGQAVRWTLHACEANGATWGLGWAQLAGPDQVPAAMASLKALSSSNWGGTVGPQGPWVPPGATPFASSARYQVQGRDPKGTPLSVETALFAQGALVVQATIMGAVHVDARQAWWSGMRMNP